MLESIAGLGREEALLDEAIARLSAGADELDEAIVRAGRTLQEGERELDRLGQEAMGRQARAEATDLIEGLGPAPR
jgi:hypothetical protein